ncbi:MAG: diguanylate cyclase [Phycisphaerae bacterium]
MSEPAAEICVLEDDGAERELLLRRLRRDGHHVIGAANGADGLAVIRRHHPRIVICDLLMPQLDGVEVCRQIRSDPTLDGTYVIVLTASATRDNKHRALNAGADDFLAKPIDADELQACLRNGMRVYRLQERLRRAALTDGLTGLWNHSHFRGLLDREFARTRRYGGCVSLLLLDLDYFKSVNDTYGHEIGNRVLRATARHLLDTVRDSDVVARYGGEEFVVVCPETPLDEATHLAQRIRVALPQVVRIAEIPQLLVTASIGVVCSTDGGVACVTDLINLADQALYDGKRRGRNCVVRSDEHRDAPAEPSVQLGEVERLRKQVVTLSLQAKEMCLQSVWALVQALEARDPYTAWHSRNVMFFTEQLAKAAGWSEAQCTIAMNAAMLHELGKIGVPDRTLQKVDPLTAEEVAILRQVPAMTCKILEPLKVFETEILIIRHLRERFDGTGYPAGMTGPVIPLGSRLVAIAEAFDSMTSDRAYRPSRSIRAALDEIQNEAGRQFDPQFVDLLERVIFQEEELWQKQIDRTQALRPRRPVELGVGR